MRLASLFRYALGIVPLDAYQVDQGKVGTPAVVVDDLTAALTQGIEELTRPVDAIKHQAKTVTVGISRSDETLLQSPLVRPVLAAGAPRDRLSYRTLRTLADINPAVAEVVGFIRYGIEGGAGAEGERATVAVVDRGGIARDIPSRTERSPELRGTKHPVAVERQVFVARGRGDGRTDRDRARDEGRRGHRHHAAARPLPRPAAGGDGPGRAAGLPQPLRGAAGRGARDRADLPRGPAGRASRSTSAHRAHPRARRPLAQR